MKKKRVFYVIIFFLIATALTFGVNEILFTGYKNKKVSYKAYESQVVCYITATGEKYHASGCQYLHSSKIKTTVNQAIADGYTSCSRCEPNPNVTELVAVTRYKTVKAPNNNYFLSSVISLSIIALIFLINRSYKKRKAKRLADKS